jgi:hypothetical protein
MSALENILALSQSPGTYNSGSVQFSQEMNAADLVAAARAALLELQLTFQEKDDEDGGSTKQGSDKGDAKKPPFGKKKKPPFGGKGGKGDGKNDSSQDDDEDDDNESGGKDDQDWSDDDKGGKGKKPPFGKKKGDKVKATALVDAAMVALSGLSYSTDDWVERTSYNSMLALASGTDTAKKPYGNVPYADPGHQSDGKKRYPVDTPEHTRAAWSYINQKKNGGEYSSEQLSQVKNKIKMAMKKHGIQGGDDSKDDDK